MSKDRFGRSCAVENCPGKTTKRIRLYAIPQSDINAWCTNLKINPRQVTTKTCVCSRHFEKECFHVKSLKKGSRPTLLLGHDGRIIPNSVRTDWKSGRFCCEVSCSSTSPPNILYSFPTDKWLLKEWLSNCVLKADMVKHKRKFLCANHFDDSMVHGRILIKDAIPKKDDKHKRPEVQEIMLRLLSNVSRPTTKQENPLIDCVVKNCPGKDSNDIALYRIPEYDLDAYCALINIRPSSITPNTRICSRHFEKKFLRVTKVSKGARPTLNLGNKGFVLPSLEPIKPHANQLRCCIVDCDSAYPPTKLHMFPSNEERCAQWLKICNIKEGRKKNLRICEKHFDPSMIIEQRLKKDAVPNMRVNNKIDVIEDQSNSFQHCFEDTINDENMSMDDDDDSDVYDGLECKSSCRTCVEVLKDCEKYREHFFALEVALQEEQENFEALKFQNEQLMAELEARMIN